MPDTPTPTSIDYLPSTDCEGDPRRQWATPRVILPTGCLPEEVAKPFPNPIDEHVTTISGSIGPS